MNQPVNLKMTTPSVRNWICPAIARGRLFVIALAFAWFALSQPARAQDGDELQENTAEGMGALHAYIATANSSFDDTAIGFNTLFRNTTGTDNTATGGGALFNNTTGNSNTATGASALAANTTGGANTATGVSALESN